MEHGPIWIVEAPAQPYPDGRFDGPATWDKIAAEPYGPTGAPLDPQQMTPEEVAYEIAVLRMQVDGWKSRYDAAHAVADAARLAADDMALVFRVWPYNAIDPLADLRDLLRLLIPPAPTWQAKEDEP